MITCKKNFDRINFLKEIGYFDKMNEYKIKYYICWGDDIPVEHENKDEILIVQNDDSYFTLVDKIFKILCFIDKTFGKRNYMLIKNDDDCIINFSLLKKYINTIKKEDYIGNLIHLTSKTYNNKWKGFYNSVPYQGPYMNGGAGYILSKNAVRTIVNSRYNKNQEKYEDKFIGDILRKEKYKIKRWNFWKPRKLGRENITDLGDLYTKDYMVYGEIMD